MLVGLNPCCSLTISFGYQRVPGVIISIPWGAGRGSVSNLEPVGVWLPRFQQDQIWHEFNEYRDIQRARKIGV